MAPEYEHITAGSVERICAQVPVQITSDSPKPSDPKPSHTLSAALVEAGIDPVTFTWFGTKSDDECFPVTYAALFEGDGPARARSFPNPPANEDLISLDAAEQSYFSLASIPKEQRKTDRYLCKVEAEISPTALLNAEVKLARKESTICSKEPLSVVGDVPFDVASGALTVTKHDLPLPGWLESHRADNASVWVNVVFMRQRGRTKGQPDEREAEKTANAERDRQMEAEEHRQNDEQQRRMEQSRMDARYSRYLGYIGASAESSLGPVHSGLSPGPSSRQTDGGLLQASSPRQAYRGVSPLSYAGQAYSGLPATPSTRQAHSGPPPASVAGGQAHNGRPPTSFAGQTPSGPPLASSSGQGYNGSFMASSSGQTYNGLSPTSSSGQGYSGLSPASSYGQGNSESPRTPSSQQGNSGPSVFSFSGNWNSVPRST